MTTNPNCGGIASRRSASAENRFEPGVWRTAPANIPSSGGVPGLVCRRSYVRLDDPPVPRRPLASALVVACSITLPSLCHAGSPVTNTAACPVVSSIAFAIAHRQIVRRLLRLRLAAGDKRAHFFLTRPSSRRSGRVGKQRDLPAGAGNGSEADERHATRSLGGGIRPSDAQHQTPSDSPEK